jgi:hypothetical protein
LVRSISGALAEAALVDVGVHPDVHQSCPLQQGDVVVSERLGGERRRD